MMNNINKLDSELDEPLEKRELEHAIAEREKKLNALIETIEQLKIDLTVIKQEYDFKAGRLYLKLDELDLELLKFKKIQDLIHKGFSFEEAQKIVEETIKKRREQIEEEYRKLDEEGKDLESRKDLSAGDQEELKELWRKLALKYHPDKAGGSEEMMKKINKAYADRDLETLRAIDQTGVDDSAETHTIEALRVRLSKVGETIQKLQEEHELLKKSEWFVLRENIEQAKKQGRDLLSELADKILSDIGQKEEQVDKLKEKYGLR